MKKIQFRGMSFLLAVLMILSVVVPFVSSYAATTDWQSVLNFNLPTTNTASTTEETKIFSKTNMAVGYFGSPYNMKALTISSTTDGSVIYKIDSTTDNYVNLKFTLKGRNHDETRTFIKYSYSKDNTAGSYSTPTALPYDNSTPATINSPDMDISALATKTIYLKLDFHLSTAGSWDWAYLQQLQVFAQFPSAVADQAEKILDFEQATQNFGFWAQGGLPSGAANPAVTISSPDETLNAYGSMQLTFKSSFTSGWVGVSKDVTTPAATAYSGFLVRLKANTTGTTGLRPLFNQNGTDFNLINNVVLTDTAGNKITTESAGTVFNAEFFTVPTAFNGYIFIPATGLDTTKAFTMRFLFTQKAVTWAEASVIFDDIYYYSGNSTSTIISKIPITNPNSTINVSAYTVQGFEGATQPFSYPGSKFDLTQNKTSVLHGTGSLELKFGTALGDVSEAVSGDLPAVSDAYSGYAIRLKSTCPTASGLRFLPVQSNKQISLGGGVLFYNMSGTLVTNNTLKLNEYNEVPANFDGFIFVPFSGKINATDSNYDSRLAASLQLLLRNGWGTGSLYIDDISYYSGSNYAEIINYISNANPPEDASLHDRAMMTFADFENANPFTLSSTTTDTQLQMSFVSDAAMSGSKSLKVYTTKAANEGSYAIEMPVSGTDKIVDGLFMRMNTEAADQSRINVSVVQNGVVTNLGHNVQYYRWDRAGLSPQTTEESATKSILIPAELKGYIFVPFAGVYAGNPYVDTTKDFTLKIKFISKSGASWADVATLLDDVGYYANNQYYKILKDFVPKSKIVTDTALTAIANFEDGTNPFTTDSSITSNVTVNKSSVLNGNESLILTYSPDFSTGYAQKAIEGTAGARGLVFRTRFSAPANVKLRVGLVQNGKTTYLGSFARFVTGQTLYKEIEKKINNEIVLVQEEIDNPYTIDASTNSILMPRFFDGYITLPFAGELQNNGFNPADSFTLKFEFENGSGLATYNGGNTVIDDVNLYSGNYLDYSELLRKIDPTRPAFKEFVEQDAVKIEPVYTSNTAIMANFEDGTNPLPADGGQRDMFNINVSTSKRLIGGSSLEIYGTSLLKPWGRIIGKLPGANMATNGFVFRIKTDAPKNSLMRVMINQEDVSGQAKQLSFYGSAVLMDLNGNNVVLENTKSSLAWFGYLLPEYFDGFVFVPYSSLVEGPAFDSSREFTASLLFINNGGDGAIWSDTTTYIDDFGLYKGTDYKTIMKELDPAIDFTGKSSSNIVMVNNNVTLPDIYEPTLENKNLNITINGFTEGILPDDTVLVANQLSKNDYTLAASQFGSSNHLPDISVNNAYYVDVCNTKGQLFDPNGVVVINFKLPSNIDPYDIGVCTIDENKNLQYLQTVPDESTNSIKCYSRTFGPMILLSAGLPTTKVIEVEEPSSSTSSEAVSSEANNTGTDVVVTPTEPDTKTGITDEYIAGAISKSTTDTILLNVTNNSTLSAAQLQTLKDSGKKVNIYVYDDANKLLAVWQFSALDNITQDLDLTIIPQSENADKISSLVKDSKAQVLTFKYHGTLPGKAQIIFPNDKGFTKSDNPQLYFYNADTNVLESTDAKMAISKDEKYIVITTNHCSEYVVTTYKTSVSSAANSTGNTGKTQDNTGLIIIVIAVFIIFIAGASLMVLYLKRRNVK